jgi:hypothetical protein
MDAGQSLGSIWRCTKRAVFCIVGLLAIAAGMQTLQKLVLQMNMVKNEDTSQSLDH